MTIRTRYDRIRPAIVINDLAIADQTVVAESRRWSTGTRSTPIGEDDLAEVDLSAFVEHALVVGVHAIGAAGTAQESVALERLVADVGARTAESASQAARAADTAVTQATEAIRSAADAARRAIAEASAEARRGFAEDIETARRSMMGEVNRLVGGEKPELVDRLRALLDTFGRDVDGRIARQTGELVAAAAKQFDPGDPTSPMARHSSALQRQHDTLKTALECNHQELTAKMEDLAVAVKVAVSARDAVERTASLTPLKGAGYTAELHPLLERIAAGLGDEYVDTGAVPGALARCKKGDGVLTVAGGDVRIVLEMTTANRSNWNDYLAEAERNRNADASLGLVRDATQNGGSTVRCLGPRRITLAFDPSTDDPELLRTVVQLLRLSALTMRARQGGEDLDTAGEKLAEALSLLTKIDEIKKVAAAVRRDAGRIEDQTETVRTALTRLLTQAQEALSAAAGPAAHQVA